MKTDVRDLIAKLLQDAKRLQEIEPNAGTEARITEAKKVLNSNIVCYTRRIRNTERRYS